MDWGPRPFRFDNNWLMQKDLFPMVRTWCAQVEVQRFAGFRLMKKLQYLKSKIK